jgi:Cu2+-exporting ATPase
VAERREFCCTGCQFVYELIAAQGLDKFYDLAGTKRVTLPPVKSFVFQKRDYSWLAASAALAELGATGGEARLMLDLQGISCLGCVWLIERLFERRPGALSIHIQTTTGRMELRWAPGRCDLPEFAQELRGFGYLVGPVDSRNPGAAPRETLTPLVRRMGLCGAFALNAMLFTVPINFGMTAESEAFVLFMRLAFLFATLSFLVGGAYFFARAWQGLRRGILHIDLPIALGLIAAYSGSLYAWAAGATNFVYFDFVSTFTFLMLVGRWVQQRAIENNRNRLLSSRADPGEVALSGTGEKIPAARLTAGASFCVAPGGVIPVRSKLVSAAATLGLEWINGESDTTSARRGQLVPSGAVNCSQAAIELEAIEAWPDSILCSLLEITPKETQSGGLERFLRLYIAVVLLIAAMGFAGWLHESRDLLKSLQVLTSILVVSCPCAAGVAIPLADELAAASLRASGVFIREQSLWARLLKVRRIVFDKTGTLTLETMGLKNADAPDGLAALTSDERARLLLMVRDNLHPVSCCLRETLLAAGTHAPAPDTLRGELTEVVGLGLEFTLDETVWRLGRPGWLAKVETAHDCEFSKNGALLARFKFCEQVRPDAKEEVAALQKNGFGVHILSGDRPEKVAAMASQLGLDPDHCHGGMTPVEKADWVRAAQSEASVATGGQTLMIGDGANDSLAFNESFCTGTPAIDRGLLEHKADFYFLGRGLSGLRHLLRAALLRRRIVWRVLSFAIAYNAVAISLCLLGLMSPLLASILMPASSLVSIAIVFGSAQRRPQSS